MGSRLLLNMVKHFVKEPTSMPEATPIAFHIPTDTSVQAVDSCRGDPEASGNVTKE